MYWHYDCPDCGSPTYVDWEKLPHEAKCQRCGEHHYPPTPAEDHYAYVDEKQYPQDIHDVVLSLRGATCIVPGCYDEAASLAHKKPFRNGGRTSVDNLVPMCARHAQSKGEHEYDEWLAKLKEETAAAKPVFEVIITTKEPKPEAPKPEVPRPSAAHAATVQPIAAGRGLEVETGEVPEPGATLWLAMPFWRGALARLVLDYDWQTRGSGTCRVWLAAWPAGPEPDYDAIGTESFRGHAAKVEHSGGGNSSSSVRLDLPAGPAGRWTAAIVVDDEGGGLVLGEYVIAGFAG
ncbi:MAG: HNH endonuclease signature motif containing protein [bacterium]